ncbi:MAG: sulfotransferase domain-containing protein [Gammaproteobacteria bacterium]|nr:sulfotransferase domain-containing protein [Gammaproteobacteria bacterium]MCB1870664.1 sulfotransferase domain-containing protein [Gammaproteobacteria bacterium]
MNTTPRKPDFFLVGAPRCATTAMFAYLGQHPQIFLPLRKEVHYFGSDLTRTPGNPWFVTNEQDYLALFKEAPESKIVGEASVLYLYSSQAAAEIKAFQPEAKIIIQLRNPIDMLYSYHGQNLLAVQEDIQDFQEAYNCVEQRRRRESIPRWCIMPEQLLYPDIAQFSAQVERYYDQFGRDRVHIMIYDDFRKDTKGEFSRLLSFLGVDPGFEPQFNSINSHRKVRFRWLQGQTQLPSLPIRLLLKLMSDKRGYHALIRLATLNSTPAKRLPLKPEFKARLKREFSGDIQKLGELLGRDLSHWVREQA